MKVDKNTYKRLREIERTGEECVKYLKKILRIRKYLLSVYILLCLGTNEMICFDRVCEWDRIF